MRNYVISLDRYGVGKWRQQMLIAICRQYPQNKRELQDAIVRGGGLTLVPSGAKQPGDPVFRAVASREALLDEVELVETAAAKLPESVRPHVLKSVTMGLPYSALTPPCGERQFRQARRNFFLWMWKLKYM